MSIAPGRTNLLVAAYPWYPSRPRARYWHRWQGVAVRSAPT